MKPYPIQLEISGPTALWTRPDTGSSPVSYVAPTFSAVKGIFESVLRWKSVNVRPTRVEICAPVQFHRYTTNYGGPLRASDAMNKGASFQFYTVVLVNVCYRLYAQAEFAGHREGNRLDAGGDKLRGSGCGLFVPHCVSRKLGIGEPAANCWSRQSFGRIRRRGSLGFPARCRKWVLAPSTGETLAAHPGTSICRVRGQESSARPG
ncbi:MAG: CRISPR-associated protein Cas5 [Verrucomicrobia bacterium]|nr:CRISPR-associated protein Cas5 [Verrucomicrobiota bacterium]